MKWLDLYPEAWEKLGVNEPSGKSSKVKLIPDGPGVNEPSGKSSKVKLIPDGPYAEIPELDDELKTIPLYAWILPAKKIPEKYNKLFEKHGIPLLN